MKSHFDIKRVDGVRYADQINAFNALYPDDFLPLKPKHLERGFWWLVEADNSVVAFAGMVPFDPFPRVGYLKRAAVLSTHRGKGLQKELLAVREKTARMETDWTHFVSECHVENIHSANNFIKAGFLLVEAERPWDKESLVWRKEIRREAAQR